MITYTYERSIINGKYDINNPNRIDIEGNQIYLSDEITSQISNLYKISCNNTVCNITFKEELTKVEKDLLETILYNHKNNI